MHPLQSVYEYWQAGDCWRLCVPLLHADAAICLPVHPSGQFIPVARSNFRPVTAADRTAWQKAAATFGRIIMRTGSVGFGLPVLKAESC